MTTILSTLAQTLQPQREAIDQWFADAFTATPPLIYSSVDLRHSGFKIAPVDTNIFPAGFNNLSDAASTRASASLQHYLRTHHPHIKKLLLIPENHTRNAGYISNLIRLLHIITHAGYEVTCARIDPEQTAPLTLHGLNETTLKVDQVIREGDTLRTASGFTPDAIILNNDLSSGLPDLLRHITQPIIPHPELGWHRRKKTDHFTHYQTIATRFAHQFDIDPWTITCQHRQCGKVNFKEKTGLECVALNVDHLLHAIRERYAEHGVTTTPYVFVKAESGTYGMGIMTAHSGEDIYALNKKLRNKMDVIKEGVMNTEVIIQEGIPTLDTMDGQPAEPFIYSVGGSVAGGIWRINDTRDAYISLNATGARFAPMGENTPEEHCFIYKIIASLTNLAAAQEAQEL